MEVYISELDIETYRGIKNLKMENLAPINIITGDNNSGKTSVLELLQSVKNPGSFRVWRELLRKDSIDLRRGLTYYDGFYDLFDINEDEKKIAYKITTDGVKHRIEMLAQFREEEVPESYLNKIQGLSYWKEDGESERIRNISKMKLELWDNGQKLLKTAIYDGQVRFIRPNDMGSNKKEKKVVYISPIRHAEGLLYLNAVLEKPELYEQMLSVLKDYDEDIISINYDNVNVTGRGVYKILSKSHKKALPLNVYGDGMKKAVDYLNTLRVEKFKEGEYTPLKVEDFNQNTLLEFVMKERRLELCFEGHRWFDLRRTTRPAMERVGYNNETARLEKDDPRYVLQIPKRELSVNPAIGSNPR